MGVLRAQVDPWLQRDVSGGDERRTFRTWETGRANTEVGCEANVGPVAGVTYTFNSTELRAVGLELEPVAPVGGAPLGVVARVRRMAATAGDVARRARMPGVAHAMHEVVAPAPRDLWNISSADENVILSNCW